jgi:hypothetical protein
VARAVEAGERFAADPAGRRRLAGLIEAALRAPALAPTLYPGHPWSTFEGAAQVADEITVLAQEVLG